MLRKIDLSKASLEELAQIQNEVLRNITFQLASMGHDFASGHDSHSSSHSKNSILARPDILRKSFPESLQE